MTLRKRHLRIGLLAAVVCAWPASAALGKWANIPLEERIRRAELVAVGKIEKVIKELDRLTVLGELRLTEVLKGDSALKVVRLAFPSPDKPPMKDGVHYTVGQEGIWILRRDPKTGHYGADYIKDWQKLDRRAAIKAIIASQAGPPPAWGKPVNGIQLGLGLKGRKFTKKDAMVFTCHARNVGKAESKRLRMSHRPAWGLLFTPAAKGQPLYASYENPMPAGLCCRVPIYSTRGQPGAQWVYKHAIGAINRAGTGPDVLVLPALSARLAGAYAAKGTLEVAEEVLKGDTITIGLRYIAEDRDMGASPGAMVRVSGDKQFKSVYLFGAMPTDLRPGKYTVNVELDEHMRQGDKVVFAPKTAIRHSERLTATYIVSEPASPPATRPAKVTDALTPQRRAGEMAKLRKTRFDLLAVADPTDLPPIEVIIAGMKDPDKAVRASAVGAVLHMGVSAEALAVLQALRERVNDEDPYVRQLASLMVKVLEPRAKFLARLAARKGQAALSRAELEEFLRTILDDKPEAALDRMVESGTMPSTGPASAAPEPVTPATQPATPQVVRALLAALKDRNRQARQEAARALGDVRPVPEEVIGALIQLFQDPQGGVRRSAVQALAKIGSPAVSPLIRALTNAHRAVPKHPPQHECVRRSAGQALAKIGSPAAVGPLIQALTNENRFVREHAARTLGLLGPVAKAAVPHLIKALDDRGGNPCAPLALGRIGAEAATVMPALAKNLRGKNVSSRDTAWALAKFGSRAVPFFIEALKDEKDKSEGVRCAAADGLGFIGPAAEASVPALIKSLRGGSWRVRRHAAEALGKIGAAAGTAVAALTRARNDKFPHVRSSARDALLGIAAGEIRRKFPKGGEAMWKALAALVKPGMQVKTMMIVLPPAARETYGRGAGWPLFTVAYPLDADFAVEASGKWTAVMQNDHMPISTAPVITRRRPNGAAPGGTSTTQPASTEAQDSKRASVWSECCGITLGVHAWHLHVDSRGGGSVGFGALHDDSCRFARGTFDFRSLCKQLHSFSKSDRARPRQVGVVIVTRTAEGTYQTQGRTAHLSNAFIRSLFDKAVASLDESSVSIDGAVGRRAKNVKGNYERQPPVPHGKPGLEGLTPRQREPASAPVEVELRAKEKAPATRPADAEAPGEEALFRLVLVDGSTLTGTFAGGRLMLQAGGVKVDVPPEQIKRMRRLKDEAVAPIGKLNCPPPCLVLLYLADRTRVKGKPTFPAVPLATVCGHVDVPLGAIRKVTLKRETANGETWQTAVVELRNGDRLHGRPRQRALNVETEQGPLSVPCMKVSRIEFVAPPPVPLPVPNLDIRATAAGAPGIVVVWRGDVPDSVADVEVLRGEGPEGPLRVLGRVDRSVCRYTDKDVKVGASYHYALRMIYGDGRAGPASSAAAAKALRFLHRINCLDKVGFVGPDGIRWDSDRGGMFHFSGYWHRGPVQCPKGLEMLYLSERWSPMKVGWRFALEPGRYEVLLHFSSLQHGCRGHGFDVVINGVTVREVADVKREAGGEGKIWVLPCRVDLECKELKVVLRGKPDGRPAISGIEIRGY